MRLECYDASELMYFRHEHIMCLRQTERGSYRLRLRRYGVSVRPNRDFTNVPKTVRPDSAQINL